jgi:hypothetical protein
VRVTIAVTSPVAAAVAAKKRARTLLQHPAPNAGKKAVRSMIQQRCVSRSLKVCVCVCHDRGDCAAAAAAAKKCARPLLQHPAANAGKKSVRSKIQQTVSVSRSLKVCVSRSLKVCVSQSVTATVAAAAAVAKKRTRTLLQHTASIAANKKSKLSTKGLTCKLYTNIE